MKQLNNELNDNMKFMQPEEVDQMSRIDAKFKKMETFKFETQLRKIVDECIDPLRER